MNVHFGKLPGWGAYLDDRVLGTFLTVILTVLYVDVIHGRHPFWPKKSCRPDMPPVFFVRKIFKLKVINQM